MRQHRRTATALPLLLLPAMLVVVGTPAAALVATCAGQEATIVGTEDDDVLVGTDGPDVIVGLGGDDTIRGGEGDDVLCGDDGADLLFGGPDDDHLDPGAAAYRRPDQLRWSDARNGIDLDLGDGRRGTSEGQGHDTFVLGPNTVVVATPFPDRIDGSPLADRIRSGGGPDTIEAGGGDDDVVLESNRRGTGHPDLVRAGPGDDRVTSWAGPDRIVLGPGDDTVMSYGNQPVEAYGGPGDDHVLAKVGPGRGPVLAGSDGHDYLTLVAELPGQRRRTIRLVAGPGRVQVVGRRASRGTVRGFEEHLLLGLARWDFRGTPRADDVASAGPEPVLVAHTYAGDDTLEGGDRDDVLVGGRGRDTARGNRGRDVCRAEVRRTCER